MLFGPILKFGRDPKIKSKSGFFSKFWNFYTLQRVRQEGQSLRWALQARISFNPTSYIRSAQDFWPRMQTASVGSRRKKQRQRMGCHANHDNCHRRYFVLSYVQNILFLQFSNEEMAWPPIYKGWVLWAQQIPIQFCCRILGFLGKRLDFWKKTQHSFTKRGWGVKGR